MTKAEALLEAFRELQGRKQQEPVQVPTVVAGVECRVLRLCKNDSQQLQLASTHGEAGACVFSLHLRK